MDIDSLGKVVGKCPSNLSCFEDFFDIVADYVLKKEITKVTCKEFYNQGSVEEITNILINDKNVKLCPLLTEVAKELIIFRKQEGIL